MSGRTTPNPENFPKYLAAGLMWGAFGATALMCCALLFEVVSNPRLANVAMAVIVAASTAVVAAFGAVFTAPIAGLLAWPLYSRGVRAYAAYALAGAVAALPLAILFQLPTNAVHDSTRIVSNVASLAWFAVSGAFGGLMATRHLRRDT